MTNILVHGLGQTEQSWDKVIEELNKSNRLYNESKYK